MTASTTTARHTSGPPAVSPAAIAAEKAAEAKKQPKTANEVLAKMEEDHNDGPIDVNTTGGIQKAIERNWRAIQALADFVDGKKTV